MVGRHAVTLIEVLVVVALSAGLLALLLPAVQVARASARNAQCKSNLRNWGVALQGYVAAHQLFPPAATWHVGTPNRHKNRGRFSVFAFLLPYVEQASKSRQFDWLQDWNAPVNVGIAKQPLGAVIQCPSAPGGRQDKHPSDYTTAVRIDPSEQTGLGNLVRRGHLRPRLNVAPGDSSWGNKHSVWEGLLVIEDVNLPRRRRKRRRPEDVSDGLTKTIALIENAGKPLCYRYRTRANCKITRFRWASPTIWMTINDVCDGDQLMNCHNNSQPYSFHQGSLNAALADGSVRAISEDVAPNVFASFITVAGRDD